MYYCSNVRFTKRALRGSGSRRSFDLLVRNDGSMFFASSKFPVTPGKRPEGARPGVSWVLQSTQTPWPQVTKTNMTKPS